jgi:hypothetical protein
MPTPVKSVNQLRLVEKATRLIQQLTGDKPTPGEVDQSGSFWAHFAQEFFSLVHRSYLVRSRGSSDDLGQSWQPLKPKTIRRKLKLAKRHKRVPASQRKFLKSRLRSGERIWGFIYSRAFSRLSATMGQRAAHLEATRIAWGVVQSLGHTPAIDPPTRGQSVPIMIDSGRLIRSYSPGRARGNVYDHPQEQVFRHEGQLVTVGTMVPYAEYAEKTRPVLTQDCGPWISRALRKAVSSLAGRLNGTGRLRARVG